MNIIFSVTFNDEYKPLEIEPLKELKMSLFLFFF